MSQSLDNISQAADERELRGQSPFIVIHYAKPDAGFRHLTALARGTASPTRYFLFHFDLPTENAPYRCDEVTNLVNTSELMRLLDTWPRISA
jgi:hypothetical protein